MKKLKKEDIIKIKNTLKPCLVKTKSGGYIKWEDKCIVFENPAQAGDFIRRHPQYEDDVEFGNAVQSIDKIDLDFPYITISDLVKSESYKLYKKIINLKSKFVIENNDIKLHVQWDRKTILFESEEEAKEFIDAHYYFFEGINYSITPPPEDTKEFIENFIDFKDIKDGEDYKESICYKA